MNINPGELNKRIRIFRKVETRDADGYVCVTKPTVHACHAKFNRMSGTEVMREDADMAEVKARFLIRHTRRTITRKMFVEYAGNEYEIEYVNDYNDSREYTELCCRMLTLEAAI